MSTMRDYPEPKPYLHAHIRRSAQRDAKALHKIGVNASPGLKRMMFDRALTEAERDFKRETRSTLRHNIRHLKRQMNQERRARLRMTHARNGLVTAVCGMMLLAACIYQVLHGNYAMGALYAVCVLIFGAIYAASVLFS